MTPLRTKLSFSRPACDPQLWMLDPKVIFLNHGSFGSCPRPVLEFQRQIRDRLERQPVHFFVRDLEPLLDDARHILAEFLGASGDDLVFVPNATSGINTVLRSLVFADGDELLVTNHEYNACRNALDFVAERSGARVVVAQIPFPVTSSDQAVTAVLQRVSPRTRLVLLDHVTSQTGLVLPLERLIGELNARGVDSLVDGAHAPGMVPLNLENMSATYYTGNCHKWLCAPKGAAFLWVKRERQHLIRPLTISHGANSRRADRSRFLIEFGWTGTCDPSAYLCVPEALRTIGSLLPGGWPEVMNRNRELALKVRDLLCGALDIAPPCPNEMIGALVSVPIVDAVKVEVPSSPLYLDPLQDQLRIDHSIELPIIPWPAPPKRVLRVSAQLYNSLPQYELLSAVLARWKKEGLV
jgi:isopenicillin-N epimerase